MAHTNRTTFSLSTVKLTQRAINAVKTTRFSDLFGHDESAIEELSKKLFFKRFQPGECILRRGHVGNAYYILVEGSVIIRGTEDHRRKLKCSVAINDIPTEMTKEKAKHLLEHLLGSGRGGGGGGSGSGGSGGSGGSSDGRSNRDDSNGSAQEQQNNGNTTTTTNSYPDINEKVDIPTNDVQITILGILNKENNSTIYFEIKDIPNNHNTVKEMKTMVLATLHDVGKIRSALNICNITADWMGALPTICELEDEPNDGVVLGTIGVTFGERSLLTNEPVSRDVFANSVRATFKKIKRECNTILLPFLTNFVVASFLFLLLF